MGHLSFSSSAWKLPERRKESVSGSGSSIASSPQLALPPAIPMSCLGGAPPDIPTGGSMDAAQMCLEPSALNLGRLKMCELKHQQLLCQALMVWDALIRCHGQLTWLCTGSQASGPPSLSFVSLPESHGERKRCGLPWGQRSPWNQPQWQVLPLAFSPAEWLGLQAAVQSSGSRTKRRQIQISPVTLPPGAGSLTHVPRAFSSFPRILSLPVRSHVSRSP